MTFEDAYALAARELINEQCDQPDRELTAEYIRAVERFPEARERFAGDHNSQFDPNQCDPTRRGRVYALGLRLTNEANEGTLASYKEAERIRPLLVYLANKALRKDQTST